MPILKDNPTQQEIFDMAAIAVINQGKQSVEENMCQYICDDGSRCAVGHLLTKKQAMSFDEGGTIYHMSSYYADKLPNWILNNVDFVSQLQDCHDVVDAPNDESFVSKYKENMLSLAKAYNLSTSALSVNPALQAPVFDVMSWMSNILESTQDVELENDERVKVLRLEHIQSD